VQKYLRPGPASIPFSNRKENIGNIFHKFPSQARKTTEIPFSNRRYWHYIPKVPITSQKKTRKSRFQKEFKKKILALFSRQAQNTKEFPFSNEVSHHKQKKQQQKFCFQIEEALFSRSSITSQKNHGNSVFK
jgi:actin-related protein